MSMRKTGRIVAGLAIVLAFLHLERKRTASLSSSGAALPPVQLGSRRNPRRQVRWVAAVAASLGLIGAGLVTWFLYDTALPVLPRIDQHGEILVFVDDAKIEMKLEVRVASNAWPVVETDEWRDDLFISMAFRGVQSDVPVSFVLALAGSAFPGTHTTEEVVDDHVNGEERTCGLISLDASTPIECLERTGDASLTRDAWRGPVFLIRGTAERVSPDEDFAVAWVSVQSVGQTVVGADDLRVFRLPFVGSSFVWGPDERFVRESFPELGEVSTPSALTTVVVYDSLDASEALGWSNPPTDSIAPLTWQDTDGYGISASGSITDAVDERSVARNVFISGVLLGIVGGLVPTVLGTWRRQPQLHSRGRSSHN